MKIDNYLTLSNVDDVIQVFGNVEKSVEEIMLIFAIKGLEFEPATFITIFDTTLALMNDLNKNYQLQNKMLNSPYPRQSSAIFRNLMNCLLNLSEWKQHAQHPECLKYLESELKLVKKKISYGERSLVLHDKFEIIAEFLDFLKK